MNKSTNRILENRDPSLVNWGGRVQNNLRNIKNICFAFLLLKKTFNEYNTFSCIHDCDLLVPYNLLFYCLFFFLIMQFFVLDVYNSDGTPLTVDQIYIQLEKIWNSSLQTNKEPIGILTSNHRNSWGKAYNNLIKGGHCQHFLTF